MCPSSSSSSWRRPGAPPSRPPPAEPAQLVELRTERQAVQAQLERLGAVIARRKQALGPGAEPGPALVSLLQESTRLSARLDTLEREEATAARGLGETARPPAPIPAEALRPAPSDDAQRLREKADLLRDREDQLRKRLAEVDGRIRTLGRERALERRVSEFVREQDLFDEDDRRVAASRSELSASNGTPPTNGASVAAAPSNAAMNPQGGGNSGGAGGAAGPGGSQQGGGGSLGGVGPQTNSAGGSLGAASSRETVVAARPEELRMDDPAAGDDDSLEGLRARHAAIEREAATLHDAAATLDRDAAKQR